LPSSGGKNGPDRGSGEFKDGKYSPTFLKLEARFAKTDLEVPINRARQIIAHTDAVNDYLNRTDNCGRVVLENTVTGRFGERHYLQDGRFSLFLEPVEDRVSVGEAYEFTIGLQDDVMPGPVRTETVRARIVDEQKEPGKKKQNRSPAAGSDGNKQGEGESAPTHGLPNYKLLTKDGRRLDDGRESDPWPEDFEDFNENDGGFVRELGSDEVLYEINYDNAYHLKYRNRQRSRTAREALTQKYILGMLILMLGHERAFRAAQRTADGQEEGIAAHADEIRRIAAKGAASTVIALTESLHKIVEQSPLVE